MKIDYRRAILQIFLIMTAMFVVIAITSGCNKDGDGEGPVDNTGEGPVDNTGGEPVDNTGGGPVDNTGGGLVDNTGGGPGDENDEQTVLTCDEGHGYKIVFADDSYKKAFVVGGKDGDKDRAIEVKFDQLTRANGFGAAMPEFKSQYDTMAAANTNSCKLAVSGDGIIGLWGSYGDGLSRFILGLNMVAGTGDNDGSGPGLIENYNNNGKVAKPPENNIGGFTNDSYTMSLTSGHVGAGNDFVDYDGTTIEGGAFRAEIPMGNGHDAWTYDNIGRLEDFPPAINIEVFARRFPLLVLFGIDAGWELGDFAKGHTATDTYESNKGWQHVFSIKPCDAEVKNGLIAAQLTKKGDADEIAGTLIDAEKLYIKGDLSGGHPKNEVLVRMGDAGANKTMFVDSFIGNPVNEVADLGFATMNYNADAGTNIIENKFHTVTKLDLVCRATITDIAGEQLNLFEAPGNGAVVTADPFTDGAKELKCYLGISNLYPDWYEAVVQEYNTANTLDKMFSENEDGHLVDGQYDTQTKTVGLVIADTGDVKLNSDESMNLVYTSVNAFNDMQMAKWKVFVGQNGVKTTYGTLKFNFSRPEIK